MNSMTILFNKKYNTFITTHKQYELLPKEFKDKCKNFTFYTEESYRELMINVKENEDIKIIEVDSILNNSDDDCIIDTNNKTKRSRATIRCIIMFVLSIILIASAWIYIYTKFGMIASIATGLIVVGCVSMIVSSCIGLYLLSLDMDEMKSE